ncbi:hypothetical protein [Phaeodactylibacter xiamenensis]|uniref:hypothetical protein n=1 Tax=Phaeodactylibacter xiamenensis TaxID=1524460 RepID=UPI003CCB95BD
MLRKYKMQIIIGTAIIAALALGYYFFRKKKTNGSSRPAVGEEAPNSKLTDMKTETDKFNVDRAMAYLN